MRSCARFVYKARDVFGTAVRELAMEAFDNGVLV